MAWVKPRTRKDGSVYFCVYFRELNHHTGKNQQTSLSWDNPNDAEHCRQLIDQVGPDKARDILRIVQSPGQVETVRQFLTKHIDTITGIEPGTRNRYRAYLKNDIGPALGEIPLTALTREDVGRWINAMQESGASGKTIANKHGFLAGALNDAVLNKHLKTNPCEGNRLPPWDREEMTFLTRDEYLILIEEVPTYWRPLVTFLITSGCRWSEATALKPKDINLTEGTVRITKAWKTGDGGYTLGVTKTKMSVRTINVPVTVLEQLDLTGEWVFTNSGRGRGQFAGGVVADDDGPVRIHSFNPNVWTPAVRRARAAGLTKKPRIHDLRHTAASWLVQAGVPLPVVQQHLGHESIQTTIAVYSHLDRTSARQASEAMQRALDGAPAPADPL